MYLFVFYLNISGTKQNAFIVLIGENNQETRPKLLENTFESKILRR